MGESYKEFHDRLSYCYYNKKEFDGKLLMKEEFERLHTLNGLYQERENIKSGRESGLTLEEINARISNL